MDAQGPPLPGAAVPSPPTSVGAATTSHFPLCHYPWHVCVTSFSSSGPFSLWHSPSFSGPRTRGRESQLQGSSGSRGAGCLAPSHAWISGFGKKRERRGLRSRLGPMGTGPCCLSLPPCSHLHLGSMTSFIHLQTSSLLPQLRSQAWVEAETPVPLSLSLSLIANDHIDYQG